MPYIHKSGNQFGLADISITNGVQCREITQAQYDALSVAEKNNGTVYFITDGTPDNLYISDTIPIGAIQAYGGTEAPNGWLMCDGSAVNRIVYRDLFAVIGTTYGEGDTVTTFNLPNLKGRVAIGADTGYALGAIGGEATHTLDITEAPSHRHWISAGTYDDGNMSTTGVSNSQDNGLAADAGAYSASDTCKAYGRYDAWAGGSNGADGKGATQGTTSPHNNMQPYVVTNYIIKAKDTYQVGTSGSGGGGYVDVDSTAVPAPNMISEFDDDAKMNSTDMTDAEIESYFDDIVYNPMIVNDTVPIGAIQAYGGEVAPNNWLICDGSEVSRTTYSKLFATIGETYGVGDGETTFNLPDLRGRVITGVGELGTETYTLGDSIDAGLPNITGGANMLGHTAGVTYGITTSDSGWFGALKSKNSSNSQSVAGGTGYTAAQKNSGFELDASISSPIYGNSTTVQPNTVVTNYIIKANDNEVTGGQLQALTDFFYPVGSYYETSDDTFNPNVSFGGTWVLETEGQVHVSAGENYEIGDTGGAETVTLDTTQIPNHRHQYGANTTHADGTVVSGEAFNVGLTNSSSTTIRRRYWDYTEYVGGGQAHNNMQPYIVVNRWHRTA